MKSIYLLFLLGLGFTVPPPLAYPAHFPAPAYDFTANPLTEAGIELGRHLFYEERLSGDGTLSCGSCHSPFAAFAHTDHQLSHGIGDSIGTRNAPPLFNLAWATSFHRDGAVHHLDVQPLAPLHHPGEMGGSIGAAVDTLKADGQYRKRFAAAFGDATVTGERLLKALAQFQLSLVSAGAKYDRVRAGEATFSEQEAQGYALFQQRCNDCHAEPLFTTNGFATNGLPLDTTLHDFGRQTITGLAADSLAFKISSLRNLSFTAPYMHDGRFATLRPILEHYGVTGNDRADLTAFLLTLDDRDFVFDPDHGFPRP